MKNKFTGLVPAAYSPTNRDGTLNLGAIPAMADLYRQQGLSAVFVCGTTGESHSFTTAERRLMTEAWVREKGMAVIVHAGGNNQAEVVELSRHARESGAAAVSALAPSYFRPATADDLIDFLAPAAEAAAPLPFYFYDIPSLTGVNFPSDVVLAKAAARIPNFAGLKFTNGDLMRLQSCLQLDGGAHDILFGIDEWLLAGLAMGCRGAVGSTYNYAAPVYRRILEAFAAGDLETARHEQRKTVQLVSVLLEHGVLRTGKAIMSLMGVECGPVRPPLRPVGDAELIAIARKLAPLADIFPRPLPVEG